MTKMRWSVRAESIDHAKATVVLHWFVLIFRGQFFHFIYKICEAPLTGEWFLHGISIYGPGCSKRNNNGPSVFVRPGAFIQFIRDVTGDCTAMYEE